MTRREPVGQEHSAGCGAACVAFVLNETYMRTLRRLRRLALRGDEKKRGFWRKELLAALSEGGAQYRLARFRKSASEAQRKHEVPQGAIVFFKCGGKEPYKHYLVRWDEQWMDPWADPPKTISRKKKHDAVPPKKGTWRPRLPRSWVPANEYLAPCA